MQTSFSRLCFRQFSVFVSCLIFLISGFTAAEAQQKTRSAAQVVANAVCPDPNKPCRHRQKTFDEWELSFQMPARLVANREYKSAEFYAVILKKHDEGCEEFDSNSSIEPERRRIQKLFPTRKVFAEYSCPNMAAVNYDFAGRLDAKGEKVLYMDYIAVYAGKSRAEADKLLIELRRKYPNAEVKKMTVNFTRLVQ